jgi:hypothetical protein
VELVRAYKIDYRAGGDPTEDTYEEFEHTYFVCGKCSKIQGKWAPPAQ